MIDKMSNETWVLWLDPCCDRRYYIWEMHSEATPSPAMIIIEGPRVYRRARCEKHARAWAAAHNVNVGEVRCGWERCEVDAISGVSENAASDDSMRSA